jgi:tRNA dimethylallyltransferase
LTGKPLSECQQQGWWELPVAEQPAYRSPVAPQPVAQCLIVELPREELYARINRRVEEMIDAGWLDEVRRLKSLPRPWSKEASQALGYRELTEFLDGKSTLPEAVETIQMRSRQFAKRQLTWFRRLPGHRVCEGKLTFDLWHTKMS